MESTAFKERRRRLLDKMKDGIAVIRAADEKIRNFDSHYPFRQDSSFKYLTGFNEPEAILVLTSENRRSILFVRPKDELQELWTGRRMGAQKALEILEVDETYSIDVFDKIFPTLLKDHKRVYFDIFNDCALYQKVIKHCHQLNQARRKTFLSPQEFINLTPLVGLLRLQKDQNEIRFLKHAATIAAKAHKAAMAFARPGANEFEVQALMEYIFKKEGAESTSYNPIVASGDHANILHYNENNKELLDGELLLIDAGCEFKLYASDVTRTFPINGKFTSAQRDIYQLVLDAQKNALKMAFPGKTLSQIHQEAVRTLCQGLIDLKILKGTLEENLEKNTYREYYPHGTGHWLGLDVHDNSPYNDPDDNSELPLKTGMVFTVEPGLYFDKRKTQVPDHFRGIGVRIEDDIHITENAHENFSAMIPKEIKEIEKACEQDYREFLK